MEDIVRKLRLQLLRAKLALGNSERKVLTQRLQASYTSAQEKAAAKERLANLEHELQWIALELEDRFRSKGR